jgi:predicted component of type VI protein secretion system
MPTLRSISSVLEGCAFEVQGNYVMIGSETDNTVRLEHSSVSAHHAILTVGDGDFKLWDLHSANGIKVNGKPAVVAYLQDGDEILLGEVALRFESGRDGKRETAVPHPGKPVPEIVSNAGPTTLSHAQPPSPLELLQADRAPARRSTPLDEGPRPPLIPSLRQPPPIPLSAQLPARTVGLRPEIKAAQPAPLASASPPDTGLSGGGQEGPSIRPKGIVTATVRRLIWAGIFLGGIGVFVLGPSGAGHGFNFIGLVMIVLGGAALFVNLRCGSLIAPPRNRDEPNARR